MRTAFINQLVVEAGRHPEIVLLTGDLGYSVLEAFGDRFPDRFFNCGIAEQAMAGIAAGLAREGHNVYIYSIGNFPTLRCMEQLRYDVAYHGLSVKVVAVGAGYAYGSMGASHHATEDIAMMRAIPGCVVATPGDPAEARAVTALSATLPGMMYLRLGKAGEQPVHAGQPRLAVGDIVPVDVAGRGHAVLACGSILADVAGDVRHGRLDADLYSLPFVKPLDRSRLADLAVRYGMLTVIEEHQLSGGAGSAVVEVLSDLYADGTLAAMPRVRRVAIPDTFCHVGGTQQYLRQLNGLRL